MADEVKIQPVENREYLMTDDHDCLKIIRSDVEKDPQYTDDKGLPAKIVYYCRDCKEMVSAKRIPGKLGFKCATCNSLRVASGSEDSIHNYYKVHKKDRDEK